MEDLSYKALKRQGQFAKKIPSPAKNTYVITAPKYNINNQQTQQQQAYIIQQPPANPIQVPSCNQTADVAAPSTNSTIYHTSPNKKGSPKKYIIMGPGGSYYHQVQEWTENMIDLLRLVLRLFLDSMYPGKTLTCFMLMLWNIEHKEARFSLALSRQLLIISGICPYIYPCTQVKINDTKKTY